MEASHPRVDFSEQPQWRWPAWKFGMKCDDLFTTLHTQYNTYPAPLQDFEAFHHDICDISQLSSSIDDFRRHLAERKAQRIREMTNSWDDITPFITAAYSNLPDASWAPAVYFFRTRSFDSLVRLLASFLDPPDIAKDGPKPTIPTASACLLEPLKERPAVTNTPSLLPSRKSSAVKKKPDTRKTRTRGKKRSGGHSPACEAPNMRYHLRSRTRTSLQDLPKCATRLRKRHAIPSQA